MGLLSYSSKPKCEENDFTPSVYVKLSNEYVHAFLHDVIGMYDRISNVKNTVQNKHENHNLGIFIIIIYCVLIKLYLWPPLAIEIHERVSASWISMARGGHNKYNFIKMHKLHKDGERTPKNQRRKTLK